MRTRTRAGLLALAAVPLLMVAGCGDDDGDARAGLDPASDAVFVPNATVPGPTAPASVADFCAAYTAFEQTQASFDNAEDGAEEAFRAAVDTLLATGPALRMPAAARSGLATELDAAYTSLGLRLDPDAIKVGNGGTADPEAALAEFADRHCARH